MNTTGKIQNKGQVTIPTAVRRQAGLTKGDLVSFAFHRGKIVMTPKLVIDRATFPTADDEYTPAQRRQINVRLARADADIKAGRVSKAFSDHSEFIAALHKEAARLAARKSKHRAKWSFAGLRISCGPTPKRQLTSEPHLTSSPLSC